MRVADRGVRAGAGFFDGRIDMISHAHTPAQYLSIEEKQLFYFLTAVRPVGEEKSELYPEPQYFIKRSLRRPRADIRGLALAAGFFYLCHSTM